MLSKTLYTIIFLLLQCDGHVTAKSTCGGYEFERKPWKTLVGHPIKTVNLDEFHCMNVCYDMLNCFSINSYRGSNGNHKCEMNKFSRRVNPLSFISKVRYEYNEITVRCSFTGFLSFVALLLLSLSSLIVVVTTAVVPVGAFIIVAVVVNVVIAIVTGCCCCCCYSALLFLKHITSSLTSLHPY